MCKAVSPALLPPEAGRGQTQLQEQGDNEAANRSLSVKLFFKYETGGSAEGQIDGGAGEGAGEAATSFSKTEALRIV